MRHLLLTFGKSVNSGAPTGAVAKAFLPGVSVARLRSMHRKEKDPKARRRLLACMHRKQGKTIMEVAEAAGVPRSTVTSWIKNVGEGGLGKIYDVKNKGAACKLAKRQLKALERDLEAGPAAAGLGAGAWTMPLVRAHIKKKFRVDYHIHSVWDLVNRLGFAYVGPRGARGASAAGTKAPRKAGGRNPHWARASGRPSTKRA